MGREDEIRLIAYNIWEEESCPNGRDCEHWFKAEAIWEELSKKTVANTVKSDPKKVTKQTSKLKVTHKNSQKK